ESITSRFAPGAVYRRVDGIRLLRTTGALAGDWLDVPPQLDQYGAAIATDFWTGATRFDLVAASGAENCNDWTDGVTGGGVMFWSTNSDLRTPTKTDACNG